MCSVLLSPTESEWKNHFFYSLHNPVGPVYSSTGLFQPFNLNVVNVNNNKMDGLANFLFSDPVGPVESVVHIVA